MDDATRLIERARDASGLDDFGEPGFREGLDRLLASVAAEARMTEPGRAAFDAQLVDFLTTRLRIEEWYRRHPEIDEQAIVAPLIGLGLPRTGSTALACLLGEDPAVRSIRSWEASAPCPPPETATEHDDPRIADAAASLARRGELFPRVKAMLPGGPTSPTECQTFMGYDFKSHLFQALAQVPSYTQWLNHDADLVPTYRYVKRVLKLLQWRCPPTRWRLKNPSHIVWIDALDEVFPDARYWMTHRDVASVIPSGADLYCEFARPFSDDVDPHYMGRVNVETWETGMKRLIAFRDAGHDGCFFDIHFAPFQADPIPIIARLYAFLGETFTPEARAGMERWRIETPRDGSHRYDPADFGIDVAALRARFRFYTDRFAVLA